MALCQLSVCDVSMKERALILDVCVEKDIQEIDANGVSERRDTEVQLHWNVINVGNRTKRSAINAKIIQVITNHDYDLA